MGFKFKAASVKFPKKSGVLSEKDTRVVARKIKNKTDAFTKRVMKNV